MLGEESFEEYQYQILEAQLRPQLMYSENCVIAALYPQLAKNPEYDTDDDDDEALYLGVAGAVIIWLFSV